MEPISPKTKNKMWTWIAGVGLVMTALAAALLLYWSFADEEVLTVNNAPFPSRTVTSEIDRYVILNVDYCKNIEVTGKLRMSFVGKTSEVFLPIVDEKLPEGCKITDAPIAIPKDITPDTYKVRFRVVYDINPLKQDIVSEFESREFEVK